MQNEVEKALEIIKNLKAWIPTAEERARDEDTWMCIQEIKDILNGNISNYSFAKKEESPKKEHMENATIVLHSISKKEFEIMDITFHNKREKELTNYVDFCEANKTPVPENIQRELCDIGYFQDNVAEDIGDYGEVSESIHREIWEENEEESYYTIDVGVSYKITQDYWSGEIDTEVDFDYEIVSKSKDYDEEETEDLLYN